MFPLYFLDRDLGTILVAAENLTMSTMSLPAVEPAISLRIQRRRTQVITDRENT